MAIIHSKKKEVLESIVTFTKEPKTIEEIINFRLASRKNTKKGADSLRMDTFVHLSDLVSLGRVIKVKTEEQTTYQAKAS